MRNLMASSEQRIFFKDLESRFLLVSAGWLDAYVDGRPLEEVIGKTDFDIFSAPHASAAFEDEQGIIRTGEPIVSQLERETFRDRPDAWTSTTKLPLLAGSGEIIGTFGFTRDITGQVEAQEALAYQGLHDAVTGLANRIALMDRLRQALAALDHRPGRLAVLAIDLDDFKTVNDSFGHETGDRVLLEVGRRLTRISRRGDTIARLGGDEFLLLCTALSEDEDLQLICDRAMRAICAPLKDDQRDLTVTGSIGAVLTTSPLAEPDELLQRADIAMNVSKRSGGNRFEIYSAEHGGAAASSRGVAVELRQAIEDSNLFVLYQPIFDLKDGSMSGVEALVRWRHPERGVISPAEFIPVAERRGLIGAVGEFVLDQACRQLATWARADGGREGLMMAVNVSGRQLRDPELVARVGATMEHHGIAPGQLCLEITENVLIGELGDAHLAIASLATLGVRIALDDFGTGYSTLAHLRQLQADFLKIDRSFVSQIGKQSRDREIVAAVTGMAHALGMKVVAEGVETPVQREELIAIGCDSAQGFLFAKPLMPDEVAALRSRRPIAK